MKKNKKVIIIGFIILLIILLSGIIVYRLLVSEEDVKDNSFFLYNQKYTIKNCKTDDCKMPKEIKYDLLELKTEIPELDQAVEKINKDTVEYYNKTKESNLDAEECATVKDLYKHRYITSSYFSNYETDKYITITVNRQHRDLCTNESTIEPIEVYVYDKSQKRIITDAEFRTKENITSEVLERSLLYYNEDHNTNCVVKDESKLYYSMDGKLVLFTYDEISNNYFDVEIVK